ncbi:MAG: DNA mismatch repair endonuclease MutL [candidate division Zixibacteria bacterium]|nr:DNA mismatch repair endonuclease MutL [candidate division Zixibacteria bacterium]
MAEIKKLPSHLIDKIAAGEVVENPASVVKELLENSLDAGATSLDLTIEKGGTRLISLTDNGSGIAPDQVRQAFARHATSKISQEDDLRTIASYGFRGEALPAIASVSIVEMTTATAGAAEGTRIIIEGGDEVLFEPTSPRAGTTLAIKQLFYNTPARRKFLKSETSENRKVVAIYSKYAVCSYGSSLKLKSNGKEIINYPADNDLAGRLQRLWGGNIGSRLIEVEGNPMEGLRIYGMVTHPGINRGNRNQIYLMVNGRPVYDVSLMHAIRSGYGNTIDSGYFPLAAIFIELDKTAVDVNVHPAKTEVRFANERYLYSQIRKLIEAAVQVPALFSVNSVKSHQRPTPGKINKIPPRDRPQSAVGSGKYHDDKIVIRNGQNNHHHNGVESNNKFEEIPPEAEEQFDLGGERFWQLYNTFVMGFREGKIWMIDQHTAHERVLYEAALNNLYERPGTSQRLLFDLSFELDTQEMIIFEKHLPLFERLGFEIEPFGSNAVIIRGVPGYFESSSVEKLFRNLVNGFADSLSTGEDPMMALAASVACHAAIKSGETLSQEQMQGLFNRLFDCQEPYQCPHGRPTVVTISREDLEKIFKRR